MLAELATQLRGEAWPAPGEGRRDRPRRDGGGVIGMEEAVASVVILAEGLTDERHHIT